LIGSLVSFLFKPAGFVFQSLARLAPPYIPRRRLPSSIALLHRRQPWGDGGEASPKINGGVAVLPSPQYGWLTGHNRHTLESYVCLLSCIDKTAACVLLRKQRDMYAFSIFPP